MRFEWSLFSIDGYGCAGANAQWKLFTILYADPHWKALSDLDPVASGIFCWQQRKCCATAGADANNFTYIAMIGIHVECDGRCLTCMDAVKLSFFIVCIDPPVFVPD